ncbi:MAG: hypothetical protein WC604_00045 [Candidatus Gracilibacteria bacterium]
MGLEDFAGFNQNEGMDAASFEKFKEKMKRAAAQIKALQKEEKKRKKKEDELVKILLKFIKTSHKKDLVLVVSRALEQNLPANFILAIILLGNEEIQKEVGEYLMLKLPAPESPTPESQSAPAHAAAAPAAAPSSAETHAEKSMVFFKDDESLPLKIRIEIDKWIKNVIYQAQESPQKLLMYAYDVVEVEENPAKLLSEDPEENPDAAQDAAQETDPDADPYSQFEKQKGPEKKKILSHKLVQLVAHVIFDYLKQNGIEEDIVKLKEFSEFLMKGILNKIKEDLSDRKLLGE